MGGSGVCKPPVLTDLPSQAPAPLTNSGTLSDRAMPEGATTAGDGVRPHPPAPLYCDVCHCDFAASLMLCQGPPCPIADTLDQELANAPRGPSTTPLWMRKKIPRRPSRRLVKAAIEAFAPFKPDF